jgi:outer membrane receptor protein involved in Fe transport
MRKCRNPLLCSASFPVLLIALQAAAPASAQAAAPADQPPAAAATPDQSSAPNSTPTVVTDQATTKSSPGNEILVTGTRLRQPNLQSKSPVASIADQEIKLEGATNIEDVLNRLPQVTPDANENVSNGSDATAQINLRNLGSNRNLVLINGQRLLPMSGMDVNFVPGFMVKRVELLTGGASSVYGSDAISGVVNFITRDDLNGVKFDAQGGFADHYNDMNYVRSVIANAGYEQAPHHVRDGGRYEFSVAVGTNFADGRGNVTAYFGYRHINPVIQADRDVSACALNLAGDNDAFSCGGSSNNPWGKFVPLTGPNAGVSFNNTKDGNKTWVPYDSSFLYNYAPLNYFQRSDTRYTAGAFAKYEIVPQAQVYGSVMFMDDHSFSQVAPSALFQGYTYTINCDNPLMSQQQGQLLCGSDYGTSTSEDLFIGYRPVAGNARPRRDDLRHTDYRFSGGVRGDITSGIHYDVNALHSVTLFPENYQNDIDPAKANNAIQVVNVNGTPTCKSVVDGTDPACVPLDIFKYNGISDAAFNYIYAPTFTNSRSNETIFNATVNAELGTWGIRSPWATDGVGLVLGAEHRRDFFEFKADELAISKGTNPFPPASVHVDELFTEIGVPLVQDRPFVHSLSVTGGFRHSKYSNLDKWIDTYKIEGEYAPSRDIRFRGSYNRAIRAANIFELFSPQGVGNVNGQDLCAGAAPQASLQQCELSGVTQAQYGHIIECPADQCSALGGGNPALKPEIGNTYSFGTVITPRFLPHLAVSVDYWNIKVKGYISGIDPETIIDQCLVQGNPFFCSLFHRDARNGVIFGGDNSGNGGYLISTTINTGFLHTSGIDVGVSDTFGVGRYGKIDASLIGTWLQKQVTNPLPGLGSYDCKGLFGPTCGQPAPEWKHEARVTWTPRSRLVDVSLNWRYIGGTKITNNESNPFLAGDPVIINSRIKAYNYFDLATTVRPWRKLELRAGVNNLFDKSPPAIAAGLLSVFGNGNTYPGVYDPLGRYVFAGASIEF